MKDIIGYLLAPAIVVVSVIFIAWAIICLMGWAMISPVDNRERCSAIAKSKNTKNYSSSGWRADTCYIYVGDKEEVIKL